MPTGVNNATNPSIQSNSLDIITQALNQKRQMEIQKANEAAAKMQENSDLLYQTIAEFRKKNPSLTKPLQITTPKTADKTPPSTASIPQTNMNTSLTNGAKTVGNMVAQQYIPSICSKACGSIFYTFGKYVMAKNPNDLEYIQSWEVGKAAQVCTTVSTITASVALSSALAPNQTKS